MSAHPIVILIFLTGFCGAVIYENYNSENPIVNAEKYDSGEEFRQPTVWKVGMLSPIVLYIPSIILSGTLWETIFSDTLGETILFTSILISAVSSFADVTNSTNRKERLFGVGSGISVIFWWMLLSERIFHHPVDGLRFRLIVYGEFYFLMISCLMLSYIVMRSN